MDTFSVGWEEWVALSDLGLPALKVKTDTGAKTSSLHAFKIQPFGTEKNPKVRFGIHPIPDRPDIEVYCSASVVDLREVTSSNGQTELRYVIETPITIGDRTWNIEVTLANRESMAYRMLLGRTALEGITVKPDESFIQNVLDYDGYSVHKKNKTIKRPLRIAILTREPNNYSTRRLVEAGEANDHVVEIIDTKRCYLNIQGHQPEIHYDGKPLVYFDAVIPRIGASLTVYGLAVVRQFQAMGTYCLNNADAIGASRDKLAANQILARHRIAMPATVFASSPQDTKSLIDLVGGAPVVLKPLQNTQGKGTVLADTGKAVADAINKLQKLDANIIAQEFIKDAARSDLRCLVVGKKVIASMMRTPGNDDFQANLQAGGAYKKVTTTKQERVMARNAAKALGLNMAGVDIIRSEDGPKVIEVTSCPGLETIEKTSRKDVASEIIYFIEQNVRKTAKPRPKRIKKTN